MQEAVSVGSGLMIAILGAKIDEIKEMLSQVDQDQGVCEIANDNAEGQVIISGDKKKVLNFQKPFKKEKD